MLERGGTMESPVMSWKIEEFLDTLASDTPTPGGGSVAAINGAMAAGLISMVCAVMLKKKNLHEDDAHEFRTVHRRSEELRLELQRLAQQDIMVFERLSAAYKLPRTTEADASARLAAIQKITREAAEIPLAVAHYASALFPLCTAIVNRCSRLLVSDVGVAAILARSTVQAALLNVEINLSSLEDYLFVNQTRAQMHDLTVGLSEETAGIVDIVRARINA